MKSLVCYNIFSQKIKFCQIFQNKDEEGIKNYFKRTQSALVSGDVICYFDIDYRDKTDYELKCLCRDSILHILEQEISPWGL